MLMYCIIDNATPAINTVYWKNQSLPYLAHAIICEFDVSLMVQENVVQLQIAIDDALFMEEVQSDTDFSSIKSVKRQAGRNEASDISSLSSTATTRSNFPNCRQVISKSTARAAIDICVLGQITHV